MSLTITSPHTYMYIMCIYMYMELTWKSVQLWYTLVVQHISRMECMLRVGPPKSTVLTPSLADIIGPIVLPQGLSFATTTSCKEKGRKLKYSYQCAYITYIHTGKKIWSINTIIYIRRVHNVKAGTYGVISMEYICYKEYKTTKPYWFLGQLVDQQFYTHKYNVHFQCLCSLVTDTSQMSTHEYMQRKEGSETREGSETGLMASLVLPSNNQR